MSKKRSPNLEEALQKILEPGTDSEIEELEESDIEDDTSNNTVTTLARIGDDLEQSDPSDLLATENYMENEKTVGQVDGGNIIDDVELECNNDSIDLPKYLKHISRWHDNKMPPACDIHFLGDEFSLPPDDLSTWKPLNSSPGEIEQFIGIHMFMFIITLPAFYMYWETMKVKQDTHLLQISCQLLDTKRYVRTFKLVTMENAMIQKTKTTNFIKYNLF